MKKIYYVFILFIVLVNNSTAQESYRSFFGNNNTTYHIFSTITAKSKESNPFLLAYGGTFGYSFNRNDTIGIHQNLYYYISNGVDTLYIREDTLSGKIFRYFSQQEKEAVICDMSLNVGDTFQFPLIDSFFFPYSMYYAEGGKIVNVDSISYINGQKVIYLSSPQYTHFYHSSVYYESIGINLTFMEGIGPSYGPFGFINGYGYEPYLGVLLCVDKDDTLAYMTSDTLGCFQAGAGIPEIRNDGAISIYPNPAQDQVTIKIAGEKSNGTMEILNMIGNCIYQAKVDDAVTKINIQNLSPGIYFVRYCYNQKFIISKFIKL